MNLTPQLADKIAKRYDRERDYTGKTHFEKTVLAMIERYGLKILTDEARRETILTLGERRRIRNEFSARINRRNAALRAATETIAAE